MVSNLLDKTVDNLISKIQGLPLDEKDYGFSSKWKKTIGETIGTLFQLIETIGTNQITEKNIEKVKNTTNQQIDKILNEDAQKALQEFREIKFKIIQNTLSKNISILDRIDELFEKINKQENDLEDLIINFRNHKTIIESNLNLFYGEEKKSLVTRLKFYQDQINEILKQYNSTHK
ncbi:MAG: hypothetical protein PHR61_03530 [Candidatus Absconditabacteria bacterium]|nr:hypothetical protein [Candidatus Absconditabacteria bacterium]